jgi:DNA-binding IclR family transcriptional regulator
MASDQAEDSLLSRTMRILEAFDFEARRLSASDISHRTGIPMPSAHRLVGEMVRLGLLERDLDKRVHVGVRVWE